MKQCFSLLIVFSIGVAGCSGGDKSAPKLAPVAGTVNYKGAPVADATVVFYPAKGPAATAKTDTKGAFQLRTNGQLGVSIGKNKVTVVSAPAAAEIPPADGSELKLLEKQTAIPKKYNSAETTDLTVEVPAEGNKAQVLDLTD